VIASLATVAGVLLGVRVYRRQINAQLFLAYTERYEAIISGFPPEARLARLNSARALPPRSPELTLAVLRYLNLSSEEYYLWHSGHLDRRLWKVWETELERMLSTPLVRREWAELRLEFVSYPGFASFVDSVQSRPALSAGSVRSDLRHGGAALAEPGA
jgi:hypothetical protein